MSSTSQLGKFLLLAPQLTKSWARIFISSPSQKEEEKLGKLVILTEIGERGGIFPKIKKSNVQEITKIATRELKNQYYAFLNQEPEIAFENALQKTNLSLAQILREPAKREWYEKINILALALKDNNVYFSSAGQLSAYLMYRKKIIDLLKEGKGKFNPLKIFSNLQTGQLTLNSALFLCNNNVLDYISLEKIRRIITDSGASEACQNLVNLLVQVPQEKTFLGLVVKAISKKEIASPRKKEEVEMKESKSPTLFDRRRRDRYLKKIPSGWVNLVRKVLSNRVKNGVKIYSLFRTLLSSLLFINHQIFWPILKKVLRIFLNLLSRVSSHFKRLPLSSKILLVISIILTFLFTQSIISLSQKRTQEKEIEEYSQQIEEIEKKQNAARAALIYQDEVEAKKYLDEVQALLEIFPLDTPERKEKISFLKEENQKLQRKIQKITWLKEPPLLLDLAQFNLEASGFVASGSKIYTFSSQDNTVAYLNLRDKKVKPLSLTSVNIGYLKRGEFLDSEHILFYHDSPGLALLNLLDLSLKPQELIFSPETRGIQDFKIYEDKLYLLDSQAGQIWKYQKTTLGWGESLPWLKKDGKVNLKNATSLGVDGNIYVVNSQGEILKFFKGGKENFEIQDLEPSLKKPTKIYTNLESRYLYILEPSERRLVVLEKTGKLASQYSSSVFDDLKDFVVDEREKKIYLLNGTKVYGIVTSK